MRDPAPKAGRAHVEPHIGENGAMTSTATITVFLLDDHEIVRRGLRELLEATDDIEVIGESGLAKEAARRIPALRPDIAIFDARLPDGSGIDACREVRSVDPTIKGLILTSFDDEQALTTAVLAGASGFLLKDIKGNGLVDSIRRALAISFATNRPISRMSRNATSFGTNSAIDVRAFLKASCMVLSFMDGSDRG